MQQNLRLNYIYFFPPTTIRIPKMQISSIIEISRLMNKYSRLLLWAQFFKIRLLSASLTKFQINFKKNKCSKINKKKIVGIHFSLVNLSGWYLAQKQTAAEFIKKSERIPKPSGLFGQNSFFQQFVFCSLKKIAIFKCEIFLLLANYRKKIPFDFSMAMFIS